jgi:5-formyltetrahydrofolate cyclo-ligase
VASTKESIRMEMKAIRASLDKEAVQTRSHRIALNLYALDEFKHARNVLFYLALEKEVQTREMIGQSFAMGKRVYVPVVEKEMRRLGVSELVDLNIEFKKGPYGVNEPADKYLKAVPDSIIDFVVTPGLAFDFKGGRIGYGGGYYDRFLMGLPTAVQRVGVAFDFQVIDLLPQSDSDVPVHKIIMEEKTVCCR